MSSIPATRALVDNGYPTSARYPVPETDWHRILMVALIDTLWEHFLSQPRVYVSGNLLVFYEKRNKRKHVAPDVFMVRGVEKRRRPNYLVWEEGRAPEVVIELTVHVYRHPILHTDYNVSLWALRHLAAPVCPVWGNPVALKRLRFG